MNARDWDACADPLPMLAEVYPPRSPDSVEPQSRRSRLYLLACGRAAGARLPGVCRAVVAAGERVYHGRVTDRRLRSEVYPLAEALVCCRGEAEDVNPIGRELVRLGLAAAPEVAATEDVPPGVWAGYAYLAFLPFYGPPPDVGRIPPDLHSADLLREVFGNPLARRPPLSGAWVTDTVACLARAAEAKPDRAAFQALADALRDEGCDREDVLGHLAGPGPHAHGCWALEEVLDARAADRH